MLSRFLCLALTAMLVAGLNAGPAGAQATRTPNADMPIVLAKSCKPAGPDCAAADHELVGKWRAVRLDNQTLPQDVTVTFTFYPNGKFGVFAGCNRIAGTYAATGVRLMLHWRNTTLILCPPKLRRIERLVGSTVKGSSRWQRSHDYLTILDKSGEVMSIFERASNKI